MRKVWSIGIVLFLVLCAFQITKEPLFSVPTNWPKPVYDFSKNPLKSQKVELGRDLFYDPLLSKNNQISCASCHSPFTAFTHVDHDLSHGIEDRIGTRNSPALMNLAWHQSFMWDGSINHLDMQALAPISHPDEMGEKIESVVLKLQRTKNYPALFLKAFGDSIITGQHTLKAISQFMLTLVSSNSKYDSVMRGQAQFTPQQKMVMPYFKKTALLVMQNPCLLIYNLKIMV